MQHLRDLLNGPTDQSLRELKQELADKSVGHEEVSRVLPDAIRASSSDGNDLARALGPTLSEAFQDSVKRDPQSLADAISPIMGPAIRRSISEQIRAMVQSLNTALDHSVTPKGWKWRLESWRTGKPFAEIVMLHTLIYRIEQLLLIDPKTGLLMQSVSANPDDDDADLVSSLLSAIQDFMRDSFAHSSSDGSELKTMNTNELTVWIEHSNSAILAAAVRGEPPLSLRQRLQETLENLQVRYSDRFADFNGDTALLQVVQPELEDLLESEFIAQGGEESESESTPANESPWKRYRLWAIPAVAMIGLLVWWGFASRARYIEQLSAMLDLPPTANLEIQDDTLRVTGTARSDWIAQAQNRMERIAEFDHLDVSMVELSDRTWVSYLSLLRQEPGISVASAERKGGKYVVRGWRDPLAKSPDEIMQQVGVDPATVTQLWEPYRSLDPEIGLERLKSHLDFPRTITSISLTSDSKRLILTGSASEKWVAELERTVQLLGTAAAIDTTRLSITGGKSR